MAGAPHRDFYHSKNKSETFSIEMREAPLDIAENETYRSYQVRHEI